MRVHFFSSPLILTVIAGLGAPGCGATRGLGGARSPAAQASMRIIPAGSVSSALASGAWRRVELLSFAVDRVAVTVRDYWDYTASRRVAPPLADREDGVPEALRRAHAWDGATPPARYLGHPMVGVSHAEARAFCAWRGARLPTAHEWERAVYGEDSRPFPWGEVVDPSRVNSAELGAGDTVPVLTHPRALGPFDVADGAGHILEWTDTPGAEAGTRVVMGSSWRDPLAPRAPAAPSVRADGTRSLTLGFRCVRDVRP